MGGWTIYSCINYFSTFVQHKRINLALNPGAPTGDSYDPWADCVDQNQTAKAMQSDLGFTLSNNEIYTEAQRKRRNFNNSIRFGKQSTYYFSLNYKFLLQHKVLVPITKI